jgi:hypothetical protein
MLAGREFAATVRGARNDPDSPAALAVLAERLRIEALPRMAATLLARAHRIAPRDEAILAQLVSALAADGQHARACAVLRDDQLRLHRADQVLFCHGTSWTEEPPFATDLVTRLHQFCRAPWDRHIGVDSATGASHEVPDDDSDVTTLAARIATAPVDPDADIELPALLALVEASRALEGEAAAGALRRTGPRRRAWCGSPVQSLRFA